MNKIIKIILLLLFFQFFACSEGEKTDIKIQKSVAEKMELPKKLKVTKDLKRIRDAIVVYRSMNNGKKPFSIDELDVELYYPDEYTYDKEKCEVKSKSFPYL
jgi:hypothetical protein